MKSILFLVGISLLLPAILLAQHTKSTGTTIVEIPIAFNGELKSDLSTTSIIPHRELPHAAIKLLDVLNRYAELIGAAASLFAVLVALYLGSWREIRKKPILMLYFSEEKLYPYFHKLSFGSFNTIIDFSGQKINILVPGFNARIKVANKGKSTAKNVQARIVKLEFKNQNKTSAPTTYYHPTKVKWSGESTWDPIDIVPQSHFYLDIFYAINSTSDEIVSFNEQELRKQKLKIDSDILKDIVKNDIVPDEEIYWNVWVDNPQSRGVPARYYFQGEITIYFIINAENCDPLKFEALIKWTQKDWNEPNIKIRIDKNYINNDRVRGHYE